MDWNLCLKRIFNFFMIQFDCTMKFQGQMEGQSEPLVTVKPLCFLMVGGKPEPPPEETPHRQRNSVLTQHRKACCSWVWHFFFSHWNKQINTYPEQSNGIPLFVIKRVLVQYHIYSNWDRQRCTETGREKEDKGCISGIEWCGAVLLFLRHREQSSLAHIE